MATRLTLLSLLSVGLTVAALLLASPPTSLDPVFVGLWLVGLAILEWQAVPLPYFGKFRAGTAWTVGLWGPASGLVGVLLALSWATLALVRRSWDVLPEWLAALVWMAVFQASQGLPQVAWAEPSRWLLAALLFGVVQRFLMRVVARLCTGEEYTSWLRLELDLDGLRWSSLCAGLAFCLVGGWGKLLLLPILYGFHLGAGNGVFRAQAQLAQEAYQAWLDGQETLRRAVWESVESRRQLRATAAEKASLEQLVIQLGAARELGQALQFLAQMLQVSCKLRSIAIFWSVTQRGEDLEPAIVNSPEAERWRAFRLTGLGVTVLQQAVRDGLPTIPQNPLMAQEDAALLLPLTVHGVIYLGRGEGWEEKELQWLGWVLQRSRPAVEGLAAQQVYRQQLQQAAVQTRDLAADLQGQQILLDFAQLCAGQLDRSVLWDDVCGWLAKIMPLESACLSWEGETLCSGRAWNPAMLEYAVSKVADGCLYLASVDRARWPVNPGPFSNVLALNAGPALWLVAFAGERSLTAENLEVMQGVARLLRQSLERIQLHQLVVAAHRKLEESRELWLQTHKSLAVAQMAAGVAHELNSPLGAIHLSLEAALVRSGSAGDPQHKRLQSAWDACVKAQKIVNQLQALARSQQAAMGSADVVQVMRLLLQQLEETAESHQVSCTLQAPTDLVFGVSRADLESMLLPLCLNALEALAESPTPRAMELRASCDEDGALRLVVSDNGPGIPPENLTRVCEPFFTTKRYGKSIGLGLAGAEQTCRKLGGQLRLTSTGRGTQAHILLPAPSAARE